MGRRARPTTIALVLAAVLFAAGAGLGAFTPSDGSRGPTTELDDIKDGRVAHKAMVTTEPVKVVKVTCADGGCFKSFTTISIYVKDSDGTTLRTLWKKYDDFNTKKQNFIPKVGWTIVVQGRADTDGDGSGFIRGKRWGESSHPGPTVSANDIAAGKVSQGSYVWLKPVTLREKHERPDGDVTYDIPTSAGKGYIRLELTPPFRTDGLGAKAEGSVVEPYGMVWLDHAFNHWEIHPVRCWDHDECAPRTADFVDNKR